jgi:hypothetical protein
MKPEATTANEDPADETEDQAPPANGPTEPAPAAITPPAYAPAPAPDPAPAGSGDASAAVSRARTEAAELATIAAQAARLGLTLDLAEAVQKGIKPDALRTTVLTQLAARSDAAAITVVPPPKSAAPESPLVAAVKRVTAAAKST